MRRISLVSILFLLIPTLFNCGGNTPTNIIDGFTTDPADTTTPTIISVVRADGITLESSETPDDLLSATIADATITVTFSEDIDPNTIIADNITLTGGETAVPLAFSVSADNTTVTITPENDLPQLTLQTLTFTNSISDGINHLEEISYTFNTGCATSDLFDSPATFDLSDPDAGCWTLFTNVASDMYTLEITDGVLNYNSPTTAPNLDPYNYSYLSKSFTAADLIVTITFDSMSDFYGSEDGIKIVVSNTNPNAWTTAWTGFTGVAGSSAKCRTFVNDIEIGRSSACTKDNVSGFRIRKTGSSMEFFYNISGGEDNFIPMGSGDFDPGNPYLLSIGYNFTATTSSNIRIDSFTVTGASATDQD